MATKAAYFAELAQQTAQRITGSRERWTAFLRTAGRLYKYPYHEQLMIHAQRPDATACAGYELWNNTMGRYVKRGARGIALLDNSGDQPRIRYVFDVSDTGTRQSSRPLNLWQMQDEHIPGVQEALERAFGVPARDDGLESQIEETARHLAGEYWEEHRRQLTDILEESGLEGYDEFNVGAAFRNAATVSITYALLSRCTDRPDDYFVQEDFLDIFDFNTRRTANALGTAVSELSARMFREIEVTIRTYEKNKQAERSQNHDARVDLQPQRGLSDPGHSADPHRGEASGQVREDAPRLSGGERPHPPQRPDPDRAAVSAPHGDRRDGAPEGGAADAGLSGAGPRPGEERGPDGVGAAHEQPESPGRGDGDGGADQQLILTGLFPSEAEQISFIEEAESEKPSAFSFAQEEIDQMLRLGINSEEGRMIAALEYQKGKTIPELILTLQYVYQGGYGLDAGAGHLSAWFDGAGMRLARGEEAEYAPHAQVIPWEALGERIGTLLEEGQYCTNVELEEAPGYDRKTLAQSMWYLWHDLSEEARARDFLPALSGLSGGGYPAETAALAEQMKEPSFRAELSRQFSDFLEAQARQETLLRFRYHKLDVMDRHLKEMELPLREYRSDLTQMPVVPGFITGDELNHALRGGSGISGGKERIYRFWQENHSKQEKADFLKEEYGTGGRSHALSGADGSSEDHDAKGIRYTKTGCDKVQLSWSQVVTRLDALMEHDRYLTEAERDKPETTQEARDTAEEPVPGQAVGRIDFLGTNGDPGESVEYTDARQFIQDVQRETDCGTPMAVVLYQDDAGKTIPKEFVYDLDPPPRGFYVEDAPGLAEEEPKTAEKLEEAWNHQVGDTVYLEGDPYQITDLTEHHVELLPPGQIYPIYRIESRENFERLLSQDRRNLSEPGGAEAVPAVPAVNYRITDDHLGEGGAKAKFRANMDAIRLLRNLQKEDRNAAPEEQEILSRYVGWGGLSDAFDKNKPAWASEYRELSAALSPEEYAAARASTLNAHYTSPTVIRAMYEALEQMGFESGNVLEPAMGIGNFFGMMPDSMRNSRLYGVELDPISGQIAQKLYPNADIRVAGFETTDRRDFYDVAIGNVPFGNYKVADKPYDKLGLSIHNYFFVKAMDQVRPGGVVAFVTSRFTLDSKNSDARRLLSHKADFLGAIRLPNDAFRKNAGTDVVSDIIFLQKRDRPMDIVPEWVDLTTTPDGFTMNSYFADHPEMVLGELAMESTQYGKDDLTVRPYEGKDLSELLHEAVSRIQGSYQAVELTEEAVSEHSDTIPADPEVKNFSYTVVDGEVYFRENSVMRHVDLNEKAKERVCGMVELRGIVNDLIRLQLEDYPDEQVREKQAELNTAYDSFTQKNGLLNSRANGQAFSDDSSYYLLCSLENVDEEGKLKSKADMFTKRTIKPEHSIDSVDTPSEALAVSIGERGKVDLPFMAELLGTPGEYGAIMEQLAGVIFKDPMGPAEISAGWKTADDYLSGDVRSKLRIARMAAQKDPALSVNVDALEKAQPKDLDASEIDVRLGATWIDPDYIQQFMEETFETPYYLRRSIEVKFAEMTAEWRISGKSSPSRNDVAAYTTYGTERANAYRILEETLNLKDIRIYDTFEDADGKQKRVLNKKETTLAQQKQQAIKDAFRDWIWKDPRRRERLVQKYNVLFNSTRPREYDGSHITFGGMNPEIKLREHQRNAIAHVLYGGNTLLAHEVGAGKTFEMAASAMESKRLGLSQKALFVVPNHLTLQWANEFLHLYPSAKLLVATRKDFETANRKKFCARIATGDYDAVILGHSQFEKIPLSAERQQHQLEEQIEEIEAAIAELKWQRGENFSIKQMEKTRKSLQARLEKLTAADRKDDVITFEQLGVDRLFVDESQAYKNLFLYTKMRNVAGLSTSEAQRSSDMFMKCRYLDELTGGRGVIFASGTPVSNSMTELYTVMRYLQYETLQKKNLTHFDCWASTFGETSTAIELAPEGTGYRARTRFAKFFNLPELMNMFKEAADIKTSDQLHLPVPEARFETVVVQPSDFQKDMVAELSQRAAAVHSGIVDPSEDNMLKITSDGRKLGLDQRLMNPILPDDPGSKLNACVGNVIHIWEDGKADKLTQLLFCDLSTPKKDGTFNVYDDIRAKLMAHGIPAEEVAFIHDADTEAKKKDLFAKVRSGQVRVLLGSTQKMGAGTNCQDRLVAVHHLDVGWRPSDMTQRNGRIIRQGNKNKEVQIYQYVTEGTFDAYLYQTLENKQKFISQIMTSKSPVRSCDDVDEQALSYAEIKALCAGNPLIKEKMDLDIDVARLKVLKADHQSQKYRMEDKLLKYFPAEIGKQKAHIQGMEADVKTAEAHPQTEEGFCGMEIMGRNWSDKQEAGEMILAACGALKTPEPVELGTYRGFQMELSFESFRREFDIVLKGALSHRVPLGSDARGIITRLDNGLAALPGWLEQSREQLDELFSQQTATKQELGKPFPQEAELVRKSQRLAQLDAALNMEDGGKKPPERPSVLAELKARADHIPAMKQGRGREEVL